jgi:hypothetical protein
MVEVLLDYSPLVSFPLPCFVIRLDLGCWGSKSGAGLENASVRQTSDEGKLWELYIQLRSLADIH